MMMGQYNDLVEKQRMVLAVEKWRKKVKEMAGTINGLVKSWTTTYNDGSQLIENINGFARHTEEVPSSMTTAECIDQISREGEDAKYRQ
jgi:hypothetical protein